MATVDIHYHRLLNKIIKEGITTKDESRDVTTLHIPHYTLDLRNTLGIPLITTKKLFYNSVLTELIFFLKGETNIKYLIDNNCNIWNKDAYAYYKRKCEQQKISATLGFESFVDLVKTGKTPYMIQLPNEYKLGDLGPVYGNQWHRFDQVENIINNLSKRNFNRRLLVSGWNVSELDQMVLPPCHWAWEAIQEKDGFIIKWHQRSVDAFLGLPFNIASYNTLGALISSFAGIPFYGVIGDLSNVHLYENHIEQAKEQLSRNIYTYSNRDVKYVINMRLLRSMESYKKGEIKFSTVFDDLQQSDIRIINYESHPPIKADMLAQIKVV